MAEEEEGNYRKNFFTPKYLLIYLIVGLILYGAVYFFFFANKTSSPYQAPTSQTTEEQKASEISMTVVLSAQNDSDQSGVATLASENGKTTVSIQLDSSPEGVSQPAHIHMGACPNPGEVVYPLTNVMDGTSETVLEVTLDTLRSELPLVVNVHKSTTESGTYVSCGDLK